MKKEVLIGTFLAVSSAVSVQAQEIGVASGAQVIRGELTEYATTLTSMTTLGVYWDIAEAPHWRYGAELRYASMSIDPNIDEGWLNGYYAQGNDFSVMANIRYYFNTPSNFHQRRRSFLFWTHFGVGMHAQNYNSVLTGTGVKNSSSNKVGDLSERQSNHAGALELGLGAQYYLDDHWSITFQTGAQYTGNDYLDGVSGIGDGEDWPVYGVLGAAYRIF